MRARGRTHLLTGFVHKAYPRIYALLARASGFDSALIVRGVEGGVTPSLRQSGRLFHYTGTEAEKEVTLLPADFGIADGVRPATQSNTQRENSGAEGAETPFDAASAARDAAAGLAALRGTAGPTRDALISAGAICLWHLGRCDSLRTAADVIREALDSRRALACLSGNLFLKESRLPLLAQFAGLARRIRRSNGDSSHDTSSVGRNVSVTTVEHSSPVITTRPTPR